MVKWKRLKKIGPDEVDLLGVPYRIGIVEFKPLKVGEKLYDISLKTESASGYSPEEGAYIYDKYTITVKNHGDGAIFSKDVPTKEIDKTILALYEANIKK